MLKSIIIYKDNLVCTVYDIAKKLIFLLVLIIIGLIKVKLIKNQYFCFQPAMTLPWLKQFHFFTSYCDKLKFTKNVFLATFFIFQQSRYSAIQNL